MVCQDCLAKLSDLGIPYKLATSPYTGTLTAYARGRPLTTTDHQQTLPDVELFKMTLTDQMVNQGVDAYCDGVDYIAGIQDTFLPSIWAAVTVTTSGTLMVLGKDGSLIMGWDDFIEFVLVPILLQKAFWTVVGLVVLLAIVWVVVGYLSREPQYNYTDPNGNPAKGTWTEYMTNQNAKYWFVCAKDGFAVGLRSQYTTPRDVPTDQIALFNNHCSSAPDLSPPVTTWIQWLIYATVAIGAVYITVKVVPYFLKRKS